MVFDGRWSTLWIYRSSPRLDCLSVVGALRACLLESGAYLLELVEVVGYFPPERVIENFARSVYLTLVKSRVQDTTRVSVAYGSTEQESQSSTPLFCS